MTEEIILQSFIIGFFIGAGLGVSLALRWREQRDAALEQLEVWRDARGIGRDGHY
jgi:hypothetical protein